MSLFVTGDTHGEIDISKLNTTLWPTQGYLTEDDLLVILGDYGFLWESDWSKSELWWSAWLTAKKYTVCFIDGNHENFVRLAALPEVDFYGAKAGVAYEDKNGKIYHLKRGQVYNIEGNKVFTFGGATSIDKGYRKPYVSWWPEEVPSFAETLDAEDNLVIAGNEVDYILTHTAPSDVAHMLTRGMGSVPCPTRSFLDSVAANVKYKQWHFGHFHEDWKFGKFFCHYWSEPYRIF